MLLGRVLISKHTSTYRDKGLRTRVSMPTVESQPTVLRYRVNNFRALFEESQSLGWLSYEVALVILALPIAKLSIDKSNPDL